MRKLSFNVPFIIGITIAFLITACSNNKTREATIVSEDGKTKVTIDPSDINTMSQTGDEMTKKMEELKKLTPLTLDELKAMVPEEFMGMKRSNFSANSMMGTGIVNATYKGEGDKQLKISIIDGAGEAGSGYYALNFWNVWNFEQQDDYGYQKSVNFNGQKAIEKYSKSNDEYSLIFTAKDRLLVTIEGEKIGLDGVKQAAQNLKL